VRLPGNLNSDGAAWSAPDIASRELDFCRSGMQNRKKSQSGGDMMVSSNSTGRHASFKMFFLFLALATSLLAGLAPSPASSAPVKSLADITVDRSTPELHLNTFLTAVKRSIIRMEAREWARGYYDAWLYPAITEEQSAEIGLLKRYILDSMDLSGFPEWRRESAGMETALMLWDILQAENVTPETKFRQLRDGLWVIPDTYIQVGTISSGMRLGDVVFTADTIANVPDLYQTIANRHAGGFDAYRYYTETPGGLEPPRWGGIAHKLPEFLRWSVGSNTVFQWLITALILAIVLLVPLLVGRLVGNGGIRWFVQAAATGLLAAYAPGIVIEQAGLSGVAATIMTLLFLALYNGAIVICILITGEWIGNWLCAVQEAKDKTFDTSIIRLATRIVSFMSALAVIIHGLSSAGVPVYGIIAGLGVGGLAFALAAKPTLENILAGVILFLDGSIKVGDSIESDGLTGLVEDIGMRSTRIRSLDGGLISVTNSELADKVIKNVSRRVMPPQGQAVE
jgi:MscS family membrane protein